MAKDQRERIRQRFVGEKDEWMRERRRGEGSMEEKERRIGQLIYLCFRVVIRGLILLIE